MNARITDLSAYIERKAAPPDSNGCRIWTGFNDRYGYGRVKYLGQVKLVHRAVWELRNGAIPAEMCVCHRCDNPPCVELSHLFLGTPSDNTIDMVSKGRSLKGARNPNAKLTDEQVAEMRALYQTGAFTQCYLAKRYGVGKSMAGYILRNKYWTRLEVKPCEA